jgi:hypothetical protein
MRYGSRLAFAGVLLALLLQGAAPTSAEATLEIEAKVSPHTVVLGSDTVWLTVHTDIALSRVATFTLDLNGIPVAWTKADSHGHLVAKFRIGDVKEIVAPPSAELTLSGWTRDGAFFQGSDTVRVVRGK